MMPDACDAVAFHLHVCLRSVDLARNRDRSYTRLWQPGLFGNGALIRTWRRTERPRRSRQEPYPDRASAQKRVEAILRRMQHGYEVAAWQ